VSAPPPNAALRADPPTRILNHPARAHERYRLLRTLAAKGLNPVEITRLDGDARPRKYPVFIRSEDGCYGPETGLLEDAAALEVAIAAHQDRGLPLKRRVAISFEADRFADGCFRKYGAIRIGDRILPQHILRSRDWNVKSQLSESDPAFVEEEFAYVRDNPHETALKEIFDIAKTEFGRIDYTMRDGRPIVFEINSNPSFPNFAGGSPDREKRRGIILDALVEAFAAIDTPGGRRGGVAFSPDLPRAWLMQSRRWGRVRQAIWNRRLRTIEARTPKGHP
jgi:hypothetical protein